MINRSSPLKAIFFDLDNVLVFSETTHFKAWQHVLTKFGIHDKQLDFKKMMGVCDKLQATLFKEQFQIPTNADALWQLKKESYFSLLSETLESPLGRNTFLDKVSQRCTIGVVSSCDKKSVLEVLKNENIANYFEFVIAHEDCVRHKPDPLPYLQALDIVQVDAHEALVIEDSLSGIMAAQKAGIPVIGLFKDQGPEQIVPGVNYFNHFDEIDTHLFPEISLKSVG